MPKDFLLASSQFPSGVAWLLNFFLELEVMIYRGNQPDDVWDQSPNNYLRCLKEKEEILKSWLPILSQKKCFAFKNNLTINWTHFFPTDKDLGKKIILLTRDGRDAIYSYHKREKKQQTLRETLATPTYPLDLPPAETWALFNYLWLNATPEENLFVLKFEDLKTNPMPVLKELMSFVGLEPDEEKIRKGIEGSSFEKAKTKEAEYRRQNHQASNQPLINRGGKIGEWKSSYTAEDLEFFSGFPSLILKELGYESGFQETETKKCLSDEEIESLINTWSRNINCQKLPELLPEPIIDQLSENSPFQAAGARNLIRTKPKLQLRAAKILIKVGQKNWPVVVVKENILNLKNFIKKRLKKIKK